MAPRFVDLSHILEEGMPTYPGIPPPSFGALLTHEESRDRYANLAEFRLGTADLPGNTGTYIDVPHHRYRQGVDLADVPLDSLAALPGLVLPGVTDHGGPLDLDVDGRPLAGRAVLVRTGWDRRWGTEAYWEPGPFLSAETVNTLVAGGPALVGVDFWNVDDTTDPARPVHTALLGADIVIVEHLCSLDQLPEDGFRFTAAPPRIRGGTSFPVRAFAEILE
jgi:arylformamidase